MAAKSYKQIVSSGQAMYGDLAYDLDWQLRETALRHAGEERRPRRPEPVRRPKVKRASEVVKRPKQRLPIFTVIGFATVAFLAVLTLISYVQLTELSNSIVSLKAEMKEMETENVNLTAQYEKMYDLQAVKSAVEAAGMTKPSSSQIYYIDLSGGDTAVVYDAEEKNVLSRLLTSLNHGVYTVVEYLD